jgi:Peptidase family M48
VNFTVTLCSVLVAVLGVTSLLLSIVIAVAWHVGLARARFTSAGLLALRLLPTGGAIFLTFTVVLPAFLIYEPAHELEEVGPLLVALAIFALFTVGDGIRRVCRACAAAGALFRDCGPADRSFVTDGLHVDIVDVREPIVAVIGGWRHRIVASKRVLSVCSDEEFRQVIAHEVAHVSARDNLKLLFQVGSPDLLAWVPTGTILAARWRAAAEREADERSTGSDRHKRVALASALIKVARLSTAADHALPALSMSIAVDDVEGRVRALLLPSSSTLRTTRIWSLMTCALLIPVAGVPFYRLVHQVIEALVSFGR